MAAAEVTGKRKSGKGAAKAAPVPAGWGFAPESMPEPSPVKGRGQSGKTYEFAAGMYKAKDGQFPLIILQLAAGEIRQHLDMFEDSGEVTHLWRAWRTARVYDPMPPIFLEWIAPHFDKLSEGAIPQSTRVEQRERRDAIIREYNTLVEMAENPKFPAWERSKTAIRKMLAKKFDTTDGAIKQIVLDYEAGLGSE